MTTIPSLKAAVLLLVILYGSESAGLYTGNKIKILVPHNIHHHTHTKHHFVRVPTNRGNRTEAITPRPPVVVVMPITPEVIRNMSTPQVNNQPAPQPPPMQANPMTQANPQPLAAYKDYAEFMDTIKRSSKVSQQEATRKFKIINVEKNQLEKDDSQRNIKDTNNLHVNSLTAQWRDLQDFLKANPYPGMNVEDLHFDPSTASYQYSTNASPDQSPWVGLTHIQEEFPGYQIKPSAKDSKLEAASSTASYNLKHIGYILMGDNNEHQFVGLDDISSSLIP